MSKVSKLCMVLYINQSTDYLLGALMHLFGVRGPLRLHCAKKPPIPRRGNGVFLAVSRVCVRWVSDLDFKILDYLDPVCKLFLGNDLLQGFGFSRGRNL